MTPPDAQPPEVGTLTLVDFLLARLAEDEAAARHRDVVTFGAEQRALAGVQGAFDPARILAQVAALRAVVAEHGVGTVLVDGHQVCETCVSPDDWTVTHLDPALVYPCPTLRALAAIWADHEDYRQEWKL